MQAELARADTQDSKKKIQKYPSSSFRAKPAAPTKLLKTPVETKFKLFFIFEFTKPLVLVISTKGPLVCRNTLKVFTLKS